MAFIPLSPIGIELSESIAKNTAAHLFGKSFVGSFISKDAQGRNVKTGRPLTANEIAAVDVIAASLEAIATAFSTTPLKDHLKVNVREEGVKCLEAAATSYRQILVMNTNFDALTIAVPGRVTTSSVWAMIGTQANKVEEDDTWENWENPQGKFTKFRAQVVHATRADEKAYWLIMSLITNDGAPTKLPDYINIDDLDSDE